jgi:NAD-dependent DNA ligase
MDPLSRLPTPQFEPASLAQRVAALLPGVGAKRSLDVARAFGSTRNLVLAPPDLWQQIDGIGKVIAQKIDRALDGQQ